MRKLVYVKVLHSGKDFKDPENYPISCIASLFVAAKTPFEEYEQRLDTMWDLIEGELKGEKAIHKVYMDSYCGAGLLEYRMLAERGSRAYQAMFRLMELGARLVKTEETDLMIKYLEDMEKRDMFIADTIESTLGEGETGVLFMGKAHDVPAKMANPEISQIDLKIIDYTQQVTDYLRDVLPTGQILRLLEQRENLGSGSFGSSL